MTRPSGARTPLPKVFFPVRVRMSRLRPGKTFIECLVFLFNTIQTKKWQETHRTELSIDVFINFTYSFHLFHIIFSDVLHFHPKSAPEISQRLGGTLGSKTWNRLPKPKKKGPGDGLKSIRLLYFVKKRIGINISNII